MAVKRCPRCGDLYVVAARSCADCDVELEVVEREPGEEEMPAGEDPRARRATQTGAGGGHETWELHTWTREGRRLLDGMLANAGVPAVWQGATLLTPAGEHDRVAEMVEVVAHGDARVGMDDEELAALDAEADTDGEVGYEVAGWSPEDLGRLVAALADAGVEHRWDAEGDLVVATEDEEATDAVFAGLSSDGGSSGGEDDGLAVQEALSDLFVSADRLMHNPLDGISVRLLVDAAQRAGGFQLPFGFTPRAWREIVEAAGRLLERFDAADLDEEAIQAEAAALRSLLRDYV